MAPPTFLIAGATGNTGRGTVETLSRLLQTDAVFSGYRILALTRSAGGAAAQQLAKLPKVQVAEKTWVEITPDWLREQNVKRAFIASHNLPKHFAEESTFHVAAFQAGVHYVVRISTTAANVRPNFAAYYPRTHWAIETLLGSPEFEPLRWTSLQPNVFTQLYLGPAAELVRNFAKTGKQETLKLLASEDGPVGAIDSSEVGHFAAHLLVQEDVSPYNKAKYVMNGPEDITGRGIVDMVEKSIGTKVEDVSFRNLEFIDKMAADSNEARNVIFRSQERLETERKRG
ncbi:hypothetical protein CTA2_8786 [Colletotrichum tanaceti]|uniref:NmrA-like domain-containing protein n=1 Tax=Colletotrichum tanaceti TaxID=1306861 RepID=A0A4U6XU16_9PEZI|nr:hypothetical protein CTA2_8786 [Colletotrichum tanaceti]TKW59465.1 hypothetical protein CTA1_11469 [Colletotrichum tanaceti]